MKRLLVALTLVAVVGSLLGVAAFGQRITVGCKNFTEQYIIGQMMKILLEENGYDVELTSDLSTMALREGVEAGDIDVHAEYTGTAWMTHLGFEHHPSLDNNALYHATKTVDEVQNDLVWLDPIWNNNTYALAAWPEFVEEHDLETLSDLAGLFRERDGQVSMFIDFEWSIRPDGLPFMKEFYDFPVDEDSVSTGAPGASLGALREKQVDVAMVFGTDAHIVEHDWHVFVDDKSFFPPYDLTPIVRADVLDSHPEIADILNEFVATFPGGGEPATPEIVAEAQAAWQQLVAEVDIERREDDEVAREYLVEQGLIEG